MFPFFMPTLTTPLLKIPLILSATLTTHLASTPPNPPPKSSEAEKYGDPDFASVVARAAMPFPRFFLWCNAFGETAVILAHKYPSSFANGFLSILPGPRTTASAVRISPTFLAGILLVLSGSLVRLYCYRTLGKLFTWELSVKEDHRLVTEGPYSVVRHPSYTCAVVIGLGNALSFLAPGSWWMECGFMATTWGKILAYVWAGFWLLVPWVVLGRVNVEDTMLRREFGDEWDAWAKRTPYKLFPFVY
ncbi:hypothetical protein B0H21DRAFT_19291 [Amylocystis lapponica]|nr:hypothetical protein B0H21DRAFT_19291 [Amylocystis lapponica]